MWWASAVSPQPVISAVDFGSARFGVLVFLKDKGSGSFAQHETVAVFVEGTRGGGGVVVAEGEGFHGGKTANADGDDGGFATTGNHNVGFAQLQHHQ